MGLRATWATLGSASKEKRRSKKEGKREGEQEGREQARKINLVGR